MYANVDFVMVVGTIKAQLLLKVERHSGGMLDKNKGGGSLREGRLG